MRIMILGADGMLGWQALKYFSEKYETTALVRKSEDQLRPFPLFKGKDIFTCIDVRDTARLEQAIAQAKPNVILNCVGIVKQRSQAKEAVESIEINSLHPHRLAEMCAEKDIRIIHYSTDCVFSGQKGRYDENDKPDAEDLYGRSKLLGEISYPHSVTLRSSIIGLELFNKTSLVEWFLAQNDAVNGFKNAIYSGFTTLEMCRITELVMHNRNLSGIFQVASASISKYELLKMLNEATGRNIPIYENTDFFCDRSLIGARFNRESGYIPANWPLMISELAEQIRGQK